MKRLLAACAFALLAALPSCLPFTLFEDVGADPHPPTVTLLGIGFQPLADADGNLPPTVFFPPTGFVAHPNNALETTFAFSVQYTDPGGDVQRFTVRDLDGTLNAEVTPAAPVVDIDGDGLTETLDVPDFFAGTIGLATLGNVQYTPHLAGEHHFELWAEDSHGSRSAKVTFVITFVP